MSDCVRQEEHGKGRKGLDSLEKGKMKSIHRILLEECIRCIALEGVVGIPAIGIAEASGVSKRTLGRIGVISLLIPVLVAAAFAYTRLRQQDHPSNQWRPWNFDQRQRRALVIGIVLLIVLEAAATLSGWIARVEVGSAEPLAYAGSTIWILVSLWLVGRNTAKGSS